MQNNLVLLLFFIFAGCKEETVAPKSTEEMIIGSWNVDFIVGEILQDTLSYGDVIIEFTADSMFVRNNMSISDYFLVGTTKHSSKIESICWFTHEADCPSEERREVLFINNRLNTIQLKDDTLRFGQLYVDGFDYILSNAQLRY